MKTDNFFKRNKTWIIILAVVLILLFYFVGRYNAFITLDQNVNGKWSEVENQYQRQADLVPNLVSVVSSSVSVETNFVKEVIAARTAWSSASSQFQKDVAGVQMNNGVSALVSAVAENYPVLQANKQYVALTDELAGTQNRIATARGRYIESIQSYNVAIKRFPSSLLAGIYGFGGKDYYQAELDSMETPDLGTGQLP
jgi:LemA protein